MATPTQARPISRDCGVLYVEWVDGPEARQSFDPQVLVDEEVAGDVDADLFVSPGEHQVRVKKGWVKTRPLSLRYQPGQHVVLEYKSGEFPFSLVGLAWSATTAIISYLLHDAPLFGVTGKPLTYVMFFGIWLALAGAVWALQIALDRYGITMIADGNLDVAQVDYGADAILSTVESKRQSRAHGRPGSGRLVVDLVVSAPGGIQPPLPKVIVDGKSLGTVALMHRVSPGLHTVQIRGWFDSSNKLSVQIQSGELLELECKATNGVIVAVTVIGVCSLGAMVANSHFEVIGIDWIMPLLVGVLVAAPVAAHVVSRFIPTVNLHAK